MILNHIYCATCGQLDEIEDDSIDAIITSPPYNLSYQHQRNKKHNMSGYASYSDNLPQEEYESQQIALLNACSRVLKPSGAIYYNHKERQVDGVAIHPLRWILKSQCELVQTIIWNRSSTHNLDPVRLWPVEEYIFRLRKPGHASHFNPACANWTTIWRMSFAETRKNRHPAPFPVELAQRCIQMSDTGYGGIVLDPFMGSGSTGMAAVFAGWDYIGYEISDEYVRLANRRIAFARRQCQYEKRPAEARNTPGRRAHRYDEDTSCDPLLTNT